MKTEEFTVANISCDGCVRTIKNGMSGLSGVVSVAVDKEKDLVTISHNDLSRESITAKLDELGYPEATEKNGLLQQLKSRMNGVNKN